MTDYGNLLLIIGAMIAFSGLIGTLFYSKILRRSNKGSLQLEIEAAQRQKLRDEKITADELATSAEKLAIGVRQDMKDHVDRLVAIIESKMELASVRSYSKMGEIDSKVMQLKQDLMNHIEDEKEELTRMQRSIDFFQTMQFGPEAKSIPPYITGEERTPEHEKEAYKGVFASRADTTHAESRDSAGKTTKETKGEQDKDAETESEEK
jgi:hypothetical protein